MSEIPVSGRCLCGKIEVSAPTANPEVHACHCDMCRRWGGGPALAIDCGTEVTFSGDDNLVYYPSSPWATRGFCAHCGTHVCYRINESGQYILPAGLFDQDDRFILAEQIFIDRKPAWYCFGNETRELTEDQVLALFASADD